MLLACLVVPTLLSSVLLQNTRKIVLKTQSTDDSKSPTYLNVKESRNHYRQLYNTSQYKTQELQMQI